MAQSVRCDFCKGEDGDTIYRDRRSNIHYAVKNTGKTGGYWLFPSGKHINTLAEAAAETYDCHLEDEEFINVQWYGKSSRGWDQWFCDSCARRVLASDALRAQKNQFNTSHEKVAKKKQAEPKPVKRKKKSANQGGVDEMFEESDDGPQQRE